MTNSQSHDAYRILTLPLFPVWQSVEIICQDASSFPVHWTVSTIGQPGWESITSEQLMGAVYSTVEVVHSFTFNVINSTSYCDCGACDVRSNLCGLPGLKKAVCFLCFAVHTFIGKKSVFKKTFWELWDEGEIGSKRVSTLTPSVIVELSFKMNKIFVGFNDIMVFIITYFSDAKWTLYLNCLFGFFCHFILVWVTNCRLISFFLLQKDIEGFG